MSYYDCTEKEKMRNVGIFESLEGPAIKIVKVKIVIVKLFDCLTMMHVQQGIWKP